jgi:hypothetical protein
MGEGLSIRGDLPFRLRAQIIKAVALVGIHKLQSHRTYSNHIHI